MELTKAEIIKQDKISEQGFERDAAAARDQAEFLLDKAARCDECARIARKHWQELENSP